VKALDKEHREEANWGRREILAGKKRVFSRTSKHPGTETLL
jgi:hypothetical protein